MTKGEIAKNYFENGYNCAQAVALAFSDEMGLDGDTVARLTGGFGGGIGRMREVCGTVSGAAFVMSALYGSSDPKDSKAKADLYAMIQQVAGEFKQINGSVVCRELLGIDRSGFDIPQPEARTNAYYKKRPCSELVKISADLLEAFVNEQSKK